VRNKILIAAGIIIVVSLVLVLILPYEAAQTKMYLTVTAEEYGLNVDTDALWFGSITPGSSSSRPVNISSSRDSKVVIKATGELAKWIVVSKNNFKIATGEKAEVWIAVNTPTSAQTRDYEGLLTVYFYRDFSTLKK